MMTATEMRNKAIEVQTEAIKTEKAEAIAWVEKEASPIIEIAASKGEFRASIHTKKFSERQMIEICNYFRKHGYTAVRSDAETLRVSW